MINKQEQEVHLLDYWKIVYNRRHLAITFFTVVVVLVSVYSFVATPQYQSSAKLLVNQENNNTLTFTEGGAPQIQIRDTAEYYTTQKKILFSRTFIDIVIRKYNLDKTPYFIEKKKDAEKQGVWATVRTFIGNIFPNKSIKTDYEALTNMEKPEADPWLTNFILQHMKVDVGRDGSIMEIHFVADNPAISSSLVNGIAQAYIEYTMDLRLKPYKNSVDWLSSRLVELRSKVENSEKTLQKYREDKSILSFETRENVRTQKLQQLVTEMVKAQSSRQDAEAKYNQIKAVIDKPDLLATVPDIMNNMVIQGLRNEELRLRRQASELSEKFGPKHPQMIKALSELEMVQKNLIAEARKMLNAAKTEYEIAINREKSINKSIEDEKLEVLGLSREMIEYKVVSEEAENNRRFYEMLLKKLQEATLSSGVTVSNIQIIDNAVVPTRPIKPDRQKNILMSLVVGLFGGIFLAIFVDYMDDSIKNPDDVDTQLGQHFLGMVPFSAVKEAHSDPKSPAFESYRTIRTSLVFAGSQKPLKTILITSSAPGEGKTTTATNMAVVLAQMGEKVLLIDADLRRASIHKRFKLNNTIGIGSILVERGDISSAIRQSKELPSLSVLSAGPVFPDPAGLLASEAMRDLLLKLRDNYDRIIIDSPPIMAVTDPIILSSLADGVIVIVHGGVTSKAIVKKACHSLKNINAHIIGIVLNNVIISRSGYGYYYYSYYGADSGAGRSKT